MEPRTEASPRSQLAHAPDEASTLPAVRSTCEIMRNSSSSPFSQAGSSWASLTAARLPRHSNDSRVFLAERSHPPSDTQEASGPGRHRYEARSARRRGASPVLCAHPAVHPRGIEFGPTRGAQPAQGHRRDGPPNHLTRSVRAAFQRAARRPCFSSPSGLGCVDDARTATTARERPAHTNTAHWTDHHARFRGSVDAPGAPLTGGGLACGADDSRSRGVDAGAVLVHAGERTIQQPHSLPHIPLPHSLPPHRSRPGH